MNTPLNLDTINAMDRAQFVAAFGSSFEHSPWVAERAWAKRPFASLDALHAAMLGVVEAAPREALVDFLRAHPELAGQEAQAGTMTDHSVAEQASAGLDALSRDEFRELRALNARYRERHGFPFIVAVRQHSKAQIFALLRERAAADTAAELGEALRQIGTITRGRLAQKVAA